MRAAGVIALVGVLSGCANGSSEPTLTVGVASSLADVIGRVGSDYGGAVVTYSVAGSQVLAAQVRDGAPLDVVVTADARTARRLDELGLLAGPPMRFAGNRLAIAVAPGNPHGISGLDDLVNPRLTVILAAPEVPAGAYTRQMLDDADLDVMAASFEPSVRAVVAKVELGEADAGIVYATDLAAAAVEGVTIAPARNVRTSYYAAVVLESEHAGVATDFVNYLQSEGAAATLAAFGFLP